MDPDYLKMVMDFWNSQPLLVERWKAIVEIEAQRAKILLAQEETWRLRSRAIWLQVGDGNAKFFHKFENRRKASNTIWQLPSEDGRLANSHAILSNLGISDFIKMFKSPPGATLLDIIRLVGHFPRFLKPDSMEDLTKPVTLGEFESTLKWFKRDRSLGLDG
eukprot:PITA_26516